MPTLNTSFLSCLHGSERSQPVCKPGHGFLSCLHGSERFTLGPRYYASFLSCLHGSEPWIYVALKELTVSKLPTRQ